MSFPVLVGMVVICAISGCGRSTYGVPDQENLCEVKEWMHDAVSSSCEPGQKVVFLPERWGNEQLPVIFAAVNCDLRYAVALTSGAVTCIYGPITPKPDAPEEDAEKASGESEQ